MRQGSNATPGAVTDAAGRFRVAGLVPCLYALAAGADGFVSSTRLGLEVGAGTILSNLELRLEEGGFSLSGRVLDASSGPIVGAVVRMKGFAPRDRQGQERYLWQTTTDGQGWYRAQVPRAGYEVIALADGYGPVRDYVDLIGDVVRDFRLPPEAQLTGRAISAIDRSAVAGADVYAEGTDPAAALTPTTVTSDDEGRFSISGLAPGSYRVTARKGTLVGGLPQPVVVAAAARVRDLDLTLSPGLSLDGYVRARGQAVAGAQLVLVSQTGSRWSGPAVGARSDREGRFSLGGLLPGEYRLNVFAAGHTQHHENLSIRASQTRSIEIEPSVSVSGQVLDGRGAPAADAEVTARVQASGSGQTSSADRAFTDAQGRFRLERLGPGELVLEARHQGETARIEGQVLEPGEPRDVVIKLSPGAKVSGTVKWDDGGPVAGASILAMQGGWMLPAEQRPHAAADGTFTIDSLLPGQVTISAQSPGAPPSFRGPSSPDQADLHLRPGEQRTGIRLVLSRRSGSIRGRVVDEKGQALEGTSVSAGLELSGRAFRRGAQGNSVLTGSDGTFSIEGLQVGEYTLFASQPDHADASRPGVSTGSSDVQLTMGPAGKLAGVVVDDRGKPLPSYTLLVVPPSVRRETAAMRLEGATGMGMPIPVSNPAGVFEIGALAPGRYDLQASTADGLRGNVEGLALGSGERLAGVRIVVTAGARVTGRVLELGTKAPLAAEIRLPAETIVTTRSDATGAFVLENVPPASERMLEVRTLNDDHVRERWTIAVPKGQMNVDVGTIWLMPGPDRRLEPQGGGSGLHLGRTPTQLVIYEVRPGSPGEQAGIRPGDQLLTIDGRDVQDYGLRAAGVLMIGEPGTPVTVTVARPGRPSWQVKLVRAPVPR
jgi:protocatechuate 3,4-dioxygenase beta subunit